MIIGCSIMTIQHTAALLTGRIFHGFALTILTYNIYPFVINLSPQRYKYISGVLVLVMGRVGPIILYLFGLRVT